MEINIYAPKCHECPHAHNESTRKEPERKATLYCRGGSLAGKGIWTLSSSGSTKASVQRSLQTLLSDFLRALSSPRLSRNLWLMTLISMFCVSSAEIRVCCGDLEDKRCKIIIFFFLVKRNFFTGVLAENKLPTFSQNMCVLGIPVCHSYHCLTLLPPSPIPSLAATVKGLGF